MLGQEQLHGRSSVNLVDSVRYFYAFFLVLQYGMPLKQCSQHPHYFMPIRFDYVQHYGDDKIEDKYHHA